MEYETKMIKINIDINRNQSDIEEQIATLFSNYTQIVIL